ncbi:MAG TPA: 2-C-methyl-D-erythritol 4-phosphate cytidylyltransferase [Ktedonobacteraceae bacterium]|nr:2-C-methyl-D-erythritol 4-phosphate cytidylyltransferase [Ktedonobacteraceae bacterium]
MPVKSSVIIAAAGSSRRMEGRDKLWTPLAGRVTLAHTIDVFEAAEIIDSIVLVLNSERLDDATRLCQQQGWSKITGIIEGGLRRQDSVRRGLDYLAQLAPTTQWVMIHDGARPLVTVDILETGLKTAQECDAAIAAVPVKDTIKQVEQVWISSTLERSQLWAIQTPQVFSFPLIHHAYLTIPPEQEFTDDAALLEHLGKRVAIFKSSYRNIKITTQEDILIAEALIKGLASI